MARIRKGVESQNLGQVFFTIPVGLDSLVAPLVAQGSVGRPPRLHHQVKVALLHATAGLRAAKTHKCGYHATQIK